MADFAADIKLCAQLAGNYGNKVYVQVEENDKCTNDWNWECCNEWKGAQPLRNTRSLLITATSSSPTS